MTDKWIDEYLLPAGIDIFQRGWLSANNVFLYGDGDVSLVDSGYWTHQDQTLELVSHALQKHDLPTLNKIVNTHLHSDHCGGNAALSQRFHCEVWIPVAEEIAVQSWNEDLLSYQALGQECPRFNHQGLLVPGEEVILGPYSWQIVSAPGHDHHAVMLYQPDHQILISGDALWEDGFGVIFPELWGESGFEELAQTLALIEQLEIGLVIPGHGKPFTDVKKAITNANSRLDYLASDPDRNARHGAKVLLKYKLLEWRRIKIHLAHQWIAQTPVLVNIQKQSEMTVTEFQEWLLQALVKASAARIEGEYLVNLDV
jgi:glyoxylase-like metal-dependent hydrolase (beta-lactamase superfamily II)